MTVTTAVMGTEACRLLIGQLTDTFGPLSIHVSVNYGMTVTCLPANELSLGERDVLVGRIDGVPLYMMTSEIDLWRGSVVVLDVARGAGAGFSLEAPRGVHFTLRKRAHPDKRTWDADAILAAGPPTSHIEGAPSND